MKNFKYLFFSGDEIRDMQGDTDWEFVNVGEQVQYLFHQQRTDINIVYTLNKNDSGKVKKFCSIFLPG